MSLDTLSEECIIIAAFTLILSLGAFTQNALSLARQLRQLECSRSKNINDLIQVVLYLASSLLSIFLIIGIVERRYLLMVPWLLQAFVFVALSFMYVYWFFSPAFTRLDPSCLLMTVLIFGVDIIVLYPICALCHQIRLEGN